MSSQFEDDATPPPIDLSAPIVHIEPTLEGLANAIMRVHAQLVGVRRDLTIASRDCETARRSCPAVVAHERSRRRSRETERVDTWERVGRRLSVIVSGLVLLSMVAGAWWWTARAVAAMRSDQLSLRSQVVQELRAATRDLKR